MFYQQKTKFGSQACPPAILNLTITRRLIAYYART